MESGFICSSIKSNCINPVDSFGEICVGCNCCGRINQDTKNDCLVSTYARHIATWAEHLNNETYEDYQKRNCALTVISFAQDIVKAIDDKGAK